MPNVLRLTELTHCGTGALPVLWAIALIASAICILLIYSIASFRRAPDCTPALSARGIVIEVLWATIPILILVSTALPSVKALVLATHSCSPAPIAVLETKNRH